MRILETDVLILGAGLIGSSVAMQLSDLSSKSVLVADLDLEGSLSSSELNAGGVRAIWNHPVNSILSSTSIDYYSRIADEIGFRQRGYFWMFSRQEWPKARAEFHSNPKLKDAALEYLLPAEVSRRYAFIDKTEDLGGAVFSPTAGLLNPNLLKLHYRKNAKQKGTKFEDRLWLSACVQRENIFELTFWHATKPLTHDTLESVLTGGSPFSSPHWEPMTVRAATVVNCTGAWAAKTAKILGYESPTQAVRRQVSIFECRDVDLTSYGMFVDSSGVYFHPEANNILAGFATHNEPTGVNFHYDGESFFQEEIWAKLFERSSRFENLKHVTGWAGLYEMSPDKTAILGKVEGPKGLLHGLYEAHSFSGHGAMQSYGAGLGLAQLILSGDFQVGDLRAMNSGRFKRGALLKEGLLI